MAKTSPAGGICLFGKFRLFVGRPVSSDSHVPDSVRRIVRFFGSCFVLTRGSNVKARGPYMVIVENHFTFLLIVV